MLDELLLILRAKKTSSFFLPFSHTDKKELVGGKKKEGGRKSASFSYSGYISASHVCFFHYKTSFPLSFLLARAAAAALPQTFHQGKEGEERWEMGQTVPDLWLPGDRNVLGLGDKCMAAGMPWHRGGRTVGQERRQHTILMKGTRIPSFVAQLSRLNPKPAVVKVELRYVPPTAEGEELGRGRRPH